MSQPAEEQQQQPPATTRRTSLLASKQSKIITGILTGLAAIVILIFVVKRAIVDRDERAATWILKELNDQRLKDEQDMSLAEWTYNCNITEENSFAKNEIVERSARHKREAWEKVKKINFESFYNESLKRQLRIYSELGEAALSASKQKRLESILDEMQDIYAGATLCPKGVTDKDKCTLSLDTDVRDILSSSTDPEELQRLWVDWRDAVGPKCRLLYEEFVRLSNEAAKLNDFQDASKEWTKDMEDDHIRLTMDHIWNQLKPLYLQLHAYVRVKLKERYGEIVSETGPIPAHLLGNMWAQSWTSVANFTMPHPDVPSPNIDQELKKQGYTADRLVRLAEQFFVSMNLSAMTKQFIERSMFVKPKDRKVVCHAAAWDLFNNVDYRISMCMTIVQQDFVTIHHEMGHVQYFMHYKNQPVLFRAGANDGFQEAVGDLISLSVQTTKHLRKIGLFNGPIINHREAILNNLYKLGLYQVAFLPFSYLTDLWRWDVFSGNTPPNRYNCKWWQLKHFYQGVEPPVDRSEAHFDPAGKYHIVGGVPYLRYFVSMIIQYQMHRSLCKLVGEYEENNPDKLLCECDLYNHVQAGNLLKKMLALGSSEPWQDSLEIITGQRQMDASGLLEYFKPLQNWLENENRKNGAHLGWTNTKRKVC